MSTPPQANPSSSSGVIVVGLDRTELVDQVLAQHPPHPNGYSAPLLLIDPDTSRARALLAARSELTPPRIHMFTGNRCVQDLLAHLDDRIDCPLPRSVMASGAHMAPLARQLGAGIDALAKKQGEETTRVRAALDELWGSRGVEYWRARFDEIAAGAHARVLVVATRYSTFLKHSCEDLAHALGEQGHETHLLLQRDNHAALIPLLVLRAIEEIDPDLIVVNNHPRALHRDKFPEGWPHVCWVQDAMPHLFAKLPAPVGELDFLAGHIYLGADAVEEFDRESRLEFPVPISENKFHPSEAARDTLARLGCDISYVSHQSEPAEVFCERFSLQFPPEHRDIVDKGHAMVREVIDAWGERIQDQPLDAIKVDMARMMGRPGDETLQQMLLIQFVHPLAEKLLRHQMLEWAAQIARGNGLTLKIFGNGWDAHPTLREFAQGPLVHGDDLRACYQAAGVHLHASLHGCGHQRVFECAMSGGLAISRRSWGEFYRDDWYRMSIFFARNIPHDASLVRWKHPAYVIQSHPELRTIIENRGRIPPPESGWDHEHFEDVYTRVRTDPYFKYCDFPVPPPQMRPLSLLGNPLETTFSTPDELEAMVLRAVGDADWRRTRSAVIARNARDVLSMSSFARRLMETVTTRLGHKHPLTQQEASA